MSRIIFTDKDEFLRWIKKHCKPTQYEIYITSYSEAVLAPTKSTRSLRYAYIEIYGSWDSLDEAEKNIKAALPGVDLYHIGKFDWDHTMSVGVKQTG